MPGATGRACSASTSTSTHGAVLRSSRAGWDVFSAFKQERYFDYELRTPAGTWRHYGSRPRHYSTRVLAGKARHFVREAPTPFFAYVAPFGPHTDNRGPGPKVATPDPRDGRRFHRTPVHLPPNFNRVDRHAPRYWRRQPRVGRRLARLATRRAWATVVSEDRMLRGIYRSLRRRGILGNTVIVFSSDNGYSFGSHRRVAKQCGYEECIHVPLLIRVPGVPRRTVRAVVGNQDIAPTLAALAGVPRPATDGANLIPLMRGRRSSLHRPMLLRNKQTADDKPPSFWGLRTARWKYVAQTNGERQLFDLRRDPHELRNVAGRRPAKERRLERALSRAKRGPGRSADSSRARERSSHRCR